MKKLPSTILRIFSSALEAVDPERVFGESLHWVNESLTITRGPRDEAVKVNLKGVDRIWILGAGKASVPMAAACEKFLGGRIQGV